MKSAVAEIQNCQVSRGRNVRRVPCGGVVGQQNNSDIRNMAATFRFPFFGFKGLWSYSILQPFDCLRNYQIQTEHSLNKTYKNALLSWQCLLNRKRWFRCLDKVKLAPGSESYVSHTLIFSSRSQDYISLKCFLLERFIQDLLFESSSPDLISDFLGLE